MKSQHLIGLVMAASLLLPFCLFADNKPTDGLLFEVGFAPLTLGVDADALYNGTSVNISNNAIVAKQITLRKLMGNGNAVKIGMNLDYLSNKQKADGDDFDQHAFLLGLQGGYEIHRLGTDKLSPYLGVMAGVNFLSAGEKSGNYEITGAWLDYYDEYDYELTMRSYTQLQLKGIAGCDYYFAKDIYIGMEVNYGLDYKIYPDVEAVTTGYDSKDTITVMDEASSLNFGKTMHSMLRLGFKF